MRERRDAPRSGVLLRIIRRSNAARVPCTCVCAGKPPTLGWNLLVLLGKVALQAVVALLLTYVSLHPFLVHSLWGERARTRKREMQEPAAPGDGNRCCGGGERGPCGRG
jgi:hypothetical protein